MASRDDAHRHRPMLPLLEQRPAPRADAARNRRALLAAARTILVTRGVDALSMDRVAAEAGVGVGTVYRRFRDCADLAYALLDDAERQFQAGFLSGPPPLGPGALPVARIRAFLRAYVDRLDTDVDLHALAEGHTPTGRYGGAYGLHRAHLIALLTQAVGSEADAPYLADVLLAVLGSGLYLHQRHERGFSTDRIKAGLDLLLTGLAAPGSDDASGP